MVTCILPFKRVKDGFSIFLVKEHWLHEKFGTSLTFKTRNLNKMLSPAVFNYWPGHFFAVGPNQSSRSERRFRSVFVVSTTVPLILGNLLLLNLPSSIQPLHLLWSSKFQNVYSTNTVNSSD